MYVVCIAPSRLLTLLFIGTPVSTLLFIGTPVSTLLFIGTPVSTLLFIGTPVSTLLFVGTPVSTPDDITYACCCVLGVCKRGTVQYETVNMPLRGYRGMQQEILGAMFHPP